MEFFQDDLRTYEDRESRLFFAQEAAKSLALMVKDLNSTDRSVSLMTQLAVVRSTEDRDRHIVVEEVGVIGDISNVNVILMGEKVPTALALEMDITYFFKRESPEDTDNVFTLGNIPITHIEYIERAS